ncbi:MAG: hypothetical protein MUF52_13950 [Syntrophobacteraceae bacterium]|jgi:hypothetical protein|nr:hypothetical protein [Syntrophobacteraceae bacterium]MCU0589241.1 hypothetical protein [Syntrophobacteraceae bacterium]
MLCASLFVKPLCSSRFVLCFVLLGILAMTPCLGVAADDEEVKKAFDVFQNDWIAKLNQHGEVGEDKIKVERDPQGRYRASYRAIARDRQYEVKATGDKNSPYVGVLKYEEQTFVSTADTPELARLGPFACEKEVVISEIFRYSKGKWLY